MAIISFFFLVSVFSFIQNRLDYLKAPLNKNVVPKHISLICKYGVVKLKSSCPAVLLIF